MEEFLAWEEFQTRWDRRLRKVWEQSTRALLFHKHTRITQISVVPFKPVSLGSRARNSGNTAIPQNVLKCLWRPSSELMTPSSQRSSKTRKLGSLKTDLIFLQIPKNFFKKRLVNKVSDQPGSPHFSQKQSKMKVEIRCESNSEDKCSNFTGMRVQPPQLLWRGVMFRLYKF